MIDPLPEIEDHPIPGGCDRCDAEMTLTLDPIHDGIMWLKILHATGCPVPARVRAAGSN